MFKAAHRRVLQRFVRTGMFMTTTNSAGLWPRLRCVFASETRLSPKLNASRALPIGGYGLEG